ncbi:nicotinate (nicotinamide) nucleotide adenylyltransferase [Salibacteraceae bacterium]|nr:nicotinate (nicotinamide) nucleotide adenylyltransferase [Salibacteraceae bacterium]
MNKNVGLFFGTFNPIHVGHLIIANHMTEYSNLNEVWFVVTPHSPDKKKATLLDDYHRLALVKLAIDDNSKLRASNIEFDMPQPSYTIHTLAYLKEKYPNHNFSLIMGEDNINGFHKWKNHEAILDQFEILVYPRIDANPTFIPDEKDKNALLKHKNVSIVDAPLMKISASFIRKSIKEQKDVRYLLTEPVWKYVDEMNFYK